MVAVLPQLCRLSLQLSARESQGARPSASMWNVLLRHAHCGVAASEKDGEESRGSTCVQVSFFLLLRKVFLSKTLVGRS